MASSILAITEDQEKSNLPSILSYCIENRGWGGTGISLICPLCCGVFVDPRVLPCFHTFCFICLFHMSSQKALYCCICNYRLPDNQSIEELTPHFPLLYYIEAQEELGIILCAHCSCIKRLVVLCRKCDDLICADCSENINCFGSSPRIFLSYFMEGKKQENFCSCPDHTNESLLYFCMWCETSVCPICELENHLGHHTIPVIDSISVLNEGFSNIIESNIANYFVLENAAKSLQKTVSYAQDLRQVLKTRLASYSSCKVHDPARQQLMGMADKLFAKANDLLLNIFGLLPKIHSNVERAILFYEILNKIVGCSHRLLFKKVFLNNFKKNISYTLQRIEEENFELSKSTEILVEFETTLCQCLASCTAEKVAKQLKHLTYFSKRRLHDSLSNTLPEIPIALHTHNLGLPVKPHANRKLDMDPFYTTNRTYNYSPFLKSNTNEVSNVVTHPDKSVVATLKKINLVNADGPVRTVPLQRKPIKYIIKFGTEGTGRGQFQGLWGIAAANKFKEIYLPDMNNHRIQVFDFGGDYMFHFSLPPIREPTEIENFWPYLVAVNPRSGDIVICEKYPSHKLHIFSRVGKWLRGFGAEALQNPRGIAIDRTNKVIVVESIIKKVTIFSENGEIVYSFKCSRLGFPMSVAVNDNEEMFIADNQKHLIQVFNYTGQFLRTISQVGITNYPMGVRISSQGDVVIADNHNYLKFTIFKQDGTLVTGYSTKIKQNQCHDFTFIGQDAIAITCQDNRVYICDFPSP